VAELVSETFAGRIGERFEVAPAEGDPFPVTLSRCDVTSSGDPADWVERIGRVPFSLLFHAGRATTMSQQTCTLSHPELGSFALFLVPLGPDAEGARYEAVIG
jgi:hypothetical protein